MLPRVLTLAQVEHVIKNTTVEIEVFGFGSLCVMNEGRCWLSSYAYRRIAQHRRRLLAGQVRQVGQDAGAMETRLNGILIDRFGTTSRPAIRPCARAASR